MARISLTGAKLSRSVISKPQRNVFDVGYYNSLSDRCLDMLWYCPCMHTERDLKLFRETQEAHIHTRTCTRTHKRAERTITPIKRAQMLP